MNEYQMIDTLQQALTDMGAFCIIIAIMIGLIGFVVYRMMKRYNELVFAYERLEENYRNLVRTPESVKYTKTYSK